MTVLTDTQVVTASGGLVELGYAVAADISITATSAATATTLATVPFVADGSPVLIEWNVGVVSPPVVASGILHFVLNIDGSDVRVYWGSVRNDPQGTYYLDNTLSLSHRYTPSAGSHTVVVKAYVSSGTGIIHSGSSYGDALLRVSKIVQATQWPAVTTGIIICTSSTRPASPFVGQQIYETDTSKSLIYNGTAWVQTENLGAWTTYTPTLTNIAVGTGGSAKNEGRYIRLGSLVMFEIQITLGTSGGSVSSGAIGATLPPITQQAANHCSFSARLRDAGTAIFDTLTDNSTLGRVEVYAVLTSGAYASGATPSSTVPFTWAANDEVVIWGFYEAAA